MKPPGRYFILTFLLALGLLWAAIDAVLFLLLGGASELTVRFLGESLLIYSWMYIGPLSMICGAIPSFGARVKVGLVLLTIGCAVVTGMVGWISVSMLRDLANPLIARPSYGLGAMGVILTLFADAGAVQLYRMTAITNRTSL